MNEEDEYIEYDGNNENNYNLPSENRGLSNNKAVPKRLREIRSGNTSMPKKRGGGNGVSTPSKKNNEETSGLPLSEKVHNNKQKNRGLLSRFRKNKDEKEDSNNNSNNNNDSGGSSGVDEVISKARKIKRILSIIGITAPIVFFLLFALIIIVVIHSFMANPIAAVLGFGNGENNTISESGSTSYQKEINYYNKLQSAESSYQNRCGKQLGKEYLNATLMYYYYKADITVDMNNSSDISIDYDRMSNMVDTIVELMPCDINYNVNGNFYNNLKNSSAFRSYYNDILQKESIDEILEGILEIGKISTGEIDNPRSAFIPENTKIAGTTQVTNGITGNNNSTISSTVNPSTPNVTQVSFKDYLLGIVYANVDNNYLTDNEKVKAYTIALATNVLAKNNLSVNTSTISLMEDYNTLYCNPDYGCSYVMKNNVKSLQVGGGEGGNGNTIFLAGKYYYHLSMDDSVKKNVTSLINDVYGKVMADKDDKYIEVDINKINNSNASNYEDILKDAYSNLTLKNIRENVYDNGVNYGNVLVQTPVIFYDQTDYTSSFCGLYNETISSSGCGVTSMAMIVSTYENNKTYDPVYMASRALSGYSNRYCSAGNGTYVGFFYEEANYWGYKYLTVGKYSTTDKNIITSHLREGHLIIVHVNAGSFTSSGHYMVLSGIDPDTKRVYVTDPYNRNNSRYRGTGNGWYSFNNVIIPQARAFYVIWKG